MYLYTPLILVYTTPSYQNSIAYRYIQNSLECTRHMEMVGGFEQFLMYLYTPLILVYTTPSYQNSIAYRYMQNSLECTRHMEMAWALVGRQGEFECLTSERHCKYNLSLLEQTNNCFISCLDPLPHHTWNASGQETINRTLQASYY